jgi:hypothetical protein
MGTKKCMTCNENNLNTPKHKTWLFHMYIQAEEKKRQVKASNGEWNVTLSQNMLIQ